METELNNSGNHSPVRRDRVRHMLQSFYGIGEQDIPPLDSTTFDVDYYFKTLIKSEGIVDLLNTDNKLVTGIKLLNINSS